MEINRLRHFCTVVETGHLRAAAIVLGISPGALSKSIAVFRNELGKDLFIHSGKRLLVTEFGRKVYPRAVSVLKELGQLSSISELSELSGSPSLRIATFEVFSTHFLARLIRDQHQDRNLTCFELVPGKIEEAVDSQLADLGITYFPIPKDSLDHLPVAKFGFGLFGHRKWKDVSLEELPFAVPTSHVPMLPSQVRGLDSWPASVVRKVAYEFEMLETALLVSARGDAVLHCPKFIVGLFNELTAPAFQLMELPQLANRAKSVRQTAFIVKRRDQLETREMKKVAKALRMFLSV